MSATSLKGIPKYKLIGGSKILTLKCILFNSGQVGSDLLLRYGASVVIQYFKLEKLVVTNNSHVLSSSSVNNKLVTTHHRLSYNTH